MALQPEHYGPPQFDYHECPQGGTSITVKFETGNRDPFWAEVTCSTCGAVLKPAATERVWIKGEPRWKTRRY